ncbi:hypothetical protein [Vibrio variabilis]|uniref:hypothetical protein n=1 Tax=Vibrio variabilis TaxID=990271 RepID=UPI0013A696CE|nr:hypothetical protein [Vibrio variabilis]
MVHSAKSVGGLNAGIALLNLFNLQVALDTLRSLPEESKEYRKAWEDLGVSFLWTLSAIGATAESAAKYVLTQGEGRTLLLSNLSSAIRDSHNTSNSLVTKRLISGCILGTVTGSLASGMDAYRDFSASFDPSNSLLMQTLLLIRGAAFASQSFSYSWILYRLTVLGTPISLLHAGFVSTIIFWSSLVILVIFVLIYWLTKTPIEKWIFNGYWGSSHYKRAI